MIDIKYCISYFYSYIKVTGCFSFSIRGFEVSMEEIDLLLMLSDFSN